MNKDTRDELKQALHHLEKAYNIISSVQSEEEYKYDQLPSGLQKSKAGQSLEDAVYKLDDICGQLYSIEEDIKEMTK